MKKILVGFCLTLSATGNAATIASGAHITQLMNTSGNQDKFAIQVDDMSTCTGGWIYFPFSATTAEIHKRAFAMAMTAYVSNLKVTVGSYDNSDLCNTGVLINYAH